MLATTLPAAGTAQENVTTGLSWDAVVDVYYAYDFNQPPGRLRAFATQPARHNEFNLNLALVRAQYATNRARASLGLATGTYVEANYAAEPDLFRNIFEGYAGVRLGGDTWLDAGVLPSHIGFESAITPGNRTWSRSLMAEFSPYYETGVRLSFQPVSKLAATVLVLNGWQNIRETNSGKAAGLQLQYRPTPRVLLNYSNYVGDEAPDVAEGEEDPGSLIRFFHDFYAQFAITDRLGLTGGFDIGTQERPGEDAALWYTAALLGHVQLWSKWALCARVEYFRDPDQAVVATGVEDGFITTSGSITLDHAPAERILLRLEGRLFGSRDRVWPSADGLTSRDAFLVSSIAMTF